ncbi:MAG: hypothetical protein ACNA78_01955 [Balneolaceae bacterium]
MNHMKTMLKEPVPKKNRRTLSGNNRSGGSAPAGKKTYTGGYPPHGRRVADIPKAKKQSFPSITPWKVILASFLIGVCGLLYIGHVFGTQQVLHEVQQLEAEFNRAQRLHNEKRLEYDRLVGPKEIYDKARREGFINAGPADQVLHVKP